MPPADQNPFRLPGDEELFLLREEEKRNKVQEREKKKTQHVWEKMTASTRQPTGTRLKPEGAAKGQEVGTVGAPVARERENTTDFIEKKREMFLVQVLRFW